MEFEADQQQDGALKLRRSVRWTETPQVPADTRHEWQWDLIVEGMAGAVSLSIVMGNHRGADTGQPRGAVGRHPILHGPVDVVSWADQALTMDVVPGGLAVHAYRPWPQSWSDQTPMDCPILHGGTCFNQDLEGGHRRRSGAMLKLLEQPGGLAEVWEQLEQVYREEFTPARTKQMLAQDAARDAVIRAEGAELAARMSGPTLLFIDAATLHAAGVVPNDVASGLGGLWLTPDAARAAGLIKPHDETPTDGCDPDPTADGQG